VYSSLNIFTLKSKATISMSNAKSEESSHDVVQCLAVAAVELCDGEKDEGEWDGIEEVGVAADGNWEMLV
jgi:hypothetical protein